MKVKCSFRVFRSNVNLNEKVSSNSIFRMHYSTAFVFSGCLHSNQNWELRIFCLDFEIPNIIICIFIYYNSYYSQKHYYLLLFESFYLLPSCIAYKMLVFYDVWMDKLCRKRAKMINLWYHPHFNSQIKIKLWKMNEKTTKISFFFFDQSTCLAWPGFHSRIYAK